MDLETFAWLLTAEGQRLLVRAASVTDPMREGARLREHDAADRVAAALSQVQLRKRAETKFPGLAQRLYFTPEGLEQATRMSVATHRAARLALANTRTVVDLGCGIGGDLVAFAHAGLTAAGVDLDPLRVAVATANLEALGLGGAVQQGDVTDVDTSPFDAAYVDPARRSGRGRTFDVNAWSPPWPFVRDLLTRDAVAKVAPGISHELIPEGVEAEWISDGGEVKEAALWSGRLATVRRRATIIGTGGLATLTDEDDQGGEVLPLQEWFYEPDGAVIRAGLVTAVAGGVGGGLLDEHIAYVTSAQGFRTPFARTYRVLEEVPFREKQLRAALRERGIGRLTIKKRGVSISPDTLRPRLDLRGDAEATLVLTRVAGKGTALLVDPC